MTTITRWVLAHKRIVVGFWVVLTLVGMASAGSATKALKQKFSVPGKEGWLTNQQIQRDFHRHGRQRRAAAGRGDAARRAARWTQPAVQSELRAVEARLASTLPGTRLAGYASTHSARFLSGDRQHHVRDRLSAAGPHAGLRRQPRSGQTRERGAGRHDGRGRARAPDGL